MMILTFLVIAAVTAGATTFRGVPPECQAELEAIPDSARVERVDWRPLVRHLRRINTIRNDEPFTAQVFSRLFAWRAVTMLERTRRALKDPNWTWTDPLTTELSGRIGRSAEFDPHQLPFLLTLRGFDAEAAVESHIPTLQRPRQMAQVLRLKNSAPCWLGGSRSLALAEHFWMNGNRTRWSGAIEVIADQLSSEDRARFVERAVSDIIRYRSKEYEDTETLLRTLPYLRSTKNFATLRQIARKKWVNFDRHPPARLPGVRLVQNNLLLAGRCFAMTRGHLVTLKNPEAASPVLVFVGGTLIGFIKSADYGDPSLLALRNVLDAGGRPVMAMGGTYRISNDVPWRRGRLTARAGVRRLDLDAIGVRPNDFISNRQAWVFKEAGSEDALIWAVAGAHVPADRQPALRAAVDDPGAPPDDDVARILWFALLDRMVEFRAEMEKLR